MGLRPLVLKILPTQEMCSFRLLSAPSFRPMDQTSGTFSLTIMLLGNLREHAAGDTVRPWRQRAAEQWGASAPYAAQGITLRKLHPPSRPWHGGQQRSSSTGRCRDQSRLCHPPGSRHREWTGQKWSYLWQVKVCTFFPWYHKPYLIEPHLMGSHSIVVYVLLTSVN